MTKSTPENGVQPYEGVDTPIISEGLTDDLSHVSSSSDAQTNGRVQPSPSSITEDLLAASRLHNALPPAPQTTKRITTIPIRKPEAQDFVRVRRGHTWVHDALVLTYNKDGRKYLDVSGDEALGRELIAKRWAYNTRFYTAIDQYGGLFLWEVHLHDIMGRITEWSTSTMNAAEEATTTWVQMNSDLVHGYYTWETSDAYGEPVWPDLPMNQMLFIAFGNGRRLIRSTHDPLIEALRGRPQDAQS
jgi:hypothetical protein